MAATGSSAAAEKQGRSEWFGGLAEVLQRASRAYSIRTGKRQGSGSHQFLCTLLMTSFPVHSPVRFMNGFPFLFFGALGAHIRFQRVVAHLALQFRITRPSVWRNPVLC